MSCCQEKDLTITDETYWSQPDSETSGDPNGVHTTTSTDYDFNTSLAKSHTNAAGLTTNIGYNGAFQPSLVSLPTGASSGANFNYANLSSTSHVEYDDLGTQKTITTTTNYDGWGRVVSTVAPNNAQMNTSYDAMGRVISRTNPFQSGGSPGAATTIQYDVANRAVITTLPDGNTTRSDYSGSTVTVTDQVSRKIKRESDGLGRLIKVTEQDSTGVLGQETNYTYSLLDKLTLVNQGNQMRSYKYDAIGRLLYEKIPEQTPTINDGTGTMWSCAYAYTEYGALKKKTDARGIESHYAYDALHQVTQIWYTGLGGDDSGAVRPTLPSGVAATGDVGFAYNAWGALSGVSISSPGGIGYPYTETYAFDSFTRPMSVTRTIPDHTWTNWKTYTTSYEYNLGSQLSMITYPSGQQVAVNHDNIGRPQSLTYNPGDTSGYLTGVGYNIVGQVTGLTLGNGVVEGYAYDTNSLQLTTQTAAKGATSLMNLTHSYQASAGQMGSGSTAGNAGQLMSVSGTINSTVESASYKYDLLGRLAESEQTSNGASASRYFVYDRWGNRTQVQLDKESDAIQTISLAQSGGVSTNRIASVTSGSTVNYTYDAAGNVTNDGAHAYTYDAENRVVSVDGGATAQYKYDHQNRRVTKIVGSAWTHYIWEGAQVISEHDATTAYSTNPTYQVKSARLDYIYSGRRMIHSRQRASSTAPWTTQYYLSDRLSARMTLDNSGNVSGRQAHLPFGEDFGGSGTQEKHRFTTYERDSEAASDYGVNRQHAKSVGRFMQADPYKASGGAKIPQSWNRYSYVSNDPINLVDPIGLFAAIHVPVGLCDGFLGGIYCMGIIPFDAPRPVTNEPEEPAAPRLYAGFGTGDVGRIKEAIDDALSLLDGTAQSVNIDNDCIGNLIATPTPINGKTVNVPHLYTILRLWRNGIKPDTSDESMMGPYHVINGADSEALDIAGFRRRNPLAGATIFGQAVWIYGPFFGGGINRPGQLGFRRSRAVALIHEAIHTGGVSDLDFDTVRVIGSRKLNTFIIKSCVDKNKSHNDLNFVVH
ncbi:MAG: RHS repeat-associated core domain-containing protein [Blastocatellia bacterium]